MILLGEFCHRLQNIVVNFEGRLHGEMLQHLNRRCKSREDVRTFSQFHTVRRRQIENKINAAMGRRLVLEF